MSMRLRAAQWCCFILLYHILSLTFQLFSGGQVDCFLIDLFSHAMRFLFFLCVVVCCYFCSAMTAAVKQDAGVTQRRQAPAAGPSVAAAKAAPKTVAAGHKTSARKADSNSPDLAFYFTILVTVVGISSIFFLPDSFYDDYTFGARAASKPFRTFTDFYAHYLDEHSNETNRVLHFVGTSLVLLFTALNPVLIPCAAIGGIAGYYGSTLFATLNFGLIDGLLMLALFLLFAALNDKFKAALMLPLCGYFFAWVGHFFIEQNKPATFIYPCYSLMGDLRMWFDLLTNVVPGLYTWM